MAAPEFLRKHWQKQPLLVRGALTEFRDAFSAEQLLALASRDDAESRLVQRSRGNWQVRHGPFSKRELARLPARGWTLLVQGADRLLPRAQALLQQFAFLSYARLDDVMLSLSPPGGGVGPHFDSYDVFLLQSSGTRRWRISRQRDRELVAGAPLKLLRRFRAEQEWLLEPGDMLYLPPHCAHDGIAVSEGVTCSIGFRAPNAQDIATHFVDFVRDRIELDGRYADPELSAQIRPAQLSRPMLAKLRAMLTQVRWSAQDELQFLGEYLTEPGEHVIFTRPARPASYLNFCRRVASRGARLSLGSRMLFYRNWIFINGEALTFAPGGRRMLTELADKRELKPGAQLPEQAGAALYEWYRAGYIEC
jgi:50S ribosomal protein L16 3-hydroxylase